MTYKYLSNEVLRGFDRYKYNSIDTSPISKYISHPFWNWLVKFYPLWLAPNVITLTGFMFLIAAFSMLTFYDVDFRASDRLTDIVSPIPTFVWILASLFIFMAHTLDGTDGKQARKTKSSGPLGELFDHGLDSWAVSLIAICVFSIFGRGGLADFSVDAINFYYILVACMCTFFITHWEKYNSGILYLPWSYDLSQYSMSFIFLFTAYFGYECWKFNVPYFGYDLSSGRLIIICIYFCVIGISLPLSIYNIYDAYCNGTARVKSFSQMMRPYSTLMQQLVIFSLWIHFSAANIINLEPRAMFVLSGIVFSNVSTRLIVNCMSDTTCDLVNYLPMPALLILLVGRFYVNPVFEVVALYCYTCIALFVHMHYSIHVVNQLAHHMNIKVFKIKLLDERA